MPKQSLKIERFDGGLNSQFNKRDIPDNALTKADNVMVDVQGKVRVMGASKDHELGSVAGLTFPGYGLFYFSADYDNPSTIDLLKGNEPSLDWAGSQNEEHQYSTEEDNGSFKRSTWQLDDDGTDLNYRFESRLNSSSVNDPLVQAGLGNHKGWSYDAGNNKFTCNMEDDGSKTLKLYYRGIVDPNKTYKITVTANNNVNSQADSKFRFWIHNGFSDNPGQYLSVSDWITPVYNTDTVYSHTFTANNLPNGNIGLEAYSSTVVNFSIKTFQVNQDVAPKDTDYIVAQNENVVSLRDLSNDIWKASFINLDKDNTSQSSHPSNDTMPIYYSADGILRVCDSNFDNSNTVSKWAGAIIRTNFNDTSGHATIREWNVNDQKLYSPSANSHNSSSTIYNYYPGKVQYEAHANTNGDGSELNSTDISTTISNNGLKIHVAMDSNDSTNATWQGKTYKLYVSYLYDESKQESSLYNIGTIANTSVNDLALVVAVSVQFYDSSNNIYQFNKRVTGARLYYTESDDSDGLYYNMLDIDFEKGCKKFDEYEYTAWGSTTSTTSQCPENSIGDTGGGQPVFKFKHPPKVVTYDSINGYDVDEDTIFKYKTAVIANRRCYIGNVAKLDKTTHANTVVKKYSDRIIKSPVNKFDTFPETNFLDVTVNDGDEIVRLESFADRILQFKKRKLYIINVSQDVEFLESEHEYMGVDHHSAVTKTEIGVAWSNKRGFYIYNGNEIRNLIDGKISQSEWSNFISTSGMIGYLPDKKQLIVVANPSEINDNAYIYDIITESFTRGMGVLSPNQKTNIVNDSDGNMLYGSYAEANSSVIIDSGSNYSGNVVTSNLEESSPVIHFVALNTAGNNDSQYGEMIGTTFGIDAIDLFISRYNDGANVTFTSTDGTLAVTGNTADRIINRAILESAYLSLNRSGFMNLIGQKIDDYSGTSYWRKKDLNNNNNGISIEYNGNNSFYGTSTDNTIATGNSNTAPKNKPLIFFVKKSNIWYKVYTDQAIGYVVNASGTDSSSLFANSNLAIQGLLYTGSGGGNYLYNLVTMGNGNSPVRQVSEIYGGNMPAGGTNISNLSFHITINGINTVFHAGEDNSDNAGNGGTNTAVAGSLDTNTELIANIRAKLLGNQELVSLLGSGFASATANASHNDSENNAYRYFTITGNSSGESFNIQTQVYKDRNILSFNNNPETDIHQFELVTKDIDFGNPGIKKDIYKIIVTFTSKTELNESSNSNIKVFYGVDGEDIVNNQGREISVSKSKNYNDLGLTPYSNPEINQNLELENLNAGINDSVTSITFTNKSNNVKSGDVIKINKETMLVESVDNPTKTATVRRGYNSPDGRSTHSSTDEITIIPSGSKFYAELRPNSPIKNATSFQLKFQSSGTVPAGFEINDITIFFRPKIAK